jgi:hypothetical protein
MDNKQRSLEYYFPVSGGVQRQTDPSDTTAWADMIRKAGRSRIDPNYPPAAEFLKRLPPDLQFIQDDNGAGPTVIVRPTTGIPMS